MKFIATLLFGGTFLTAELPNPEVGECALVVFDETRTEPTMIDPDGAVTGALMGQVCSYQHPNGDGGVRTVDGTFWTVLDVEQAKIIASGAAELIAADNDVFLGD